MPMHVGVAAVMDFLEDAWPQLYDHDVQATPYQHPGWLKAWTQQLGPDHEPYVLAVEEPSGQSAALVLVRGPGADGRMLVAPLSSPSAESIRLTGPGSGQAACIASAAEHLESLTDEGAQVCLPDVQDDTAFGEQLLTRWLPATDIGYATVPLPWTLAALSRSTRREHRRRRSAWQNLEDQGRRLSFTLSEDREQLLEGYHTLARLHRLRNESREAADPRVVTQPGPAWVDVIKECPGAVFIASLSVDDEVVATQLFLCRNRSAYSALTAMHPGYGYLAPGHVLIQFLVDDLATRGYESLVLGRTTRQQRSYKQQYNPIWTRSLTFERGSISDGRKDFSAALNSSADPSVDGAGRAFRRSTPLQPTATAAAGSTH